jgi:hypothetical protein
MNIKNPLSVSSINKTSLKLVHYWFEFGTGQIEQHYWHELQTRARYGYWLFVLVVCSTNLIT